MSILGLKTDTCKSRHTARRHKLVSQDSRGRRYELRSALCREYGPEMRDANAGLCECGGPLMVANGVVVRRAGDSAGFAGVKSCGRATVCPVCAAKVGAHRAGEISRVVEHSTERGGSVVLLTLTMRHHRGQGLAYLWDALSASWKAATNGRRWRSERESYGVRGYVRAVETTYGENGWHLHVHALVMFEGHASDTTVSALAESMFGRWSDRLVSCGLDAPALQHGVDWKRVGSRPTACDVLASYLTKIASGVGFEVGSSSEKTGRRSGSRSVWQIAQAAVSGEDETERRRSMALWLEWLECSRGRRMLTWSRGLRAEVGLGKELSDEEAANETVDGDAVAVIPARSWGLMRSSYADLLGDILRLTEAGHGWANLAAMVRHRDARLEIFPAPDSVREWCREGPGEPLVGVDDARAVLNVRNGSGRSAGGRVMAVVESGR